MKVLIVSDTHGEHENLIRAVEKEKPLDLMIHLGDLLGYDDYIQSIAGCPVEFVRGNMDMYASLPRDKEILIDQVHVLLTHGHCYGVSLRLDQLEQTALRRGVDVVMFGHTHVPMLIQDRTLTWINPGSISKPKQKDKKPSYIIMEKEKGKTAKFTIEYLDS